ncbi:hypothetical protein AB1Y20_001967 [Prymnesium parvum]|uniref:Non-specific serine/threonine protein kinase n=1 Tax=Prymnesium parvum TaxID=97485 RepID=A0AB34J833_PRYPA
MGGCSSKPEDDPPLPTTTVGDQKKLATDTAHQSQEPPSLDPKQKLHSQMSLTKSGFHSDIHNDKKSMASHLAHNNHRKLRDVYETAEGAVLGRGACGTVSVVKRKDTGELYAMKQVTLDGMTGGTVEELRKEIDIQRGLTHPNICRLFESFEEDNNIFIIMEICTGGALVSRMKTHRHGYGERAAATLVEKMLSAVLYCHHNGVVHRDIKLDNFIYENEAEDAELKLIDFGFAAEVQEGKESMWDQLGTPSYMAPELWSDSAKEYDSSVDMWALGVVTFMLLSGKRPFHHQDRKEKARMIKHDPLVFKGAEWDRVSEEAKDFCRKLMQKNPRDRMPASEAIAHPWIKHESNLHTGIDAAHELARHNEIIESLEAFCQADDLKKLALESIAFSTPPSKLEELRNMFVKMDVDDSGTISMDEFKAAMMMHPELPPVKIEQMFKTMDVNNSGEVDYLEFLSATISTAKSGQDRMSAMAAFSILDRDGDGYVGKSDIMHAVEGTYSEAEVDEMLASHASKNGLLNYQAFKVLMFSDKGHKLYRAASSLGNPYSQKVVEAIQQAQES